MVKLIIQYKQLKFSKHYLLYINPIFQISLTLARKVSFCTKNCNRKLKISLFLYDFCHKVVPFLIFCHIYLV